MDRKKKMLGHILVAAISIIIVFFFAMRIKLLPTGELDCYGGNYILYLLKIKSIMPIDPFTKVVKLILSIAWIILGGFAAIGSIVEVIKISMMKGER
ncbi:MAG: hypothetical protein M1269_09180 [Chloroflexi bacterium]|nr:hypothetical protein [Chloroflexota bacterium]